MGQFVVFDAGLKIAALLDPVPPGPGEEKWKENIADKGLGRE
jgi:hypothetical protein